MKRLLSVLLIVVGCGVACAGQLTTAQQNKWFANGRGYAEAVELQKTAGSPIFVYFANYSDKSQKGLCSWFEKKALQNPEVTKFLRDFIKVKFIVPLSRDDLALSEKWYVGKAPTLVVFQTNGYHSKVAPFDWSDARDPKLKKPDELINDILGALAPKGRTFERGQRKKEAPAAPAAPAGDADKAPAAAPAANPFKE
jgi:hypothetical protein